MSQSATYARPTKVFNKEFVILLIVNFLSFFNIQMLQSNIITYVNGLTSIPLVISLVPVVYSIVAMAMRPVSGVCLDRFDKKMLVIVSEIGLTASCLAYLFADTSTLVIIVRAVNGIFFGLNTTAVMALSGELLPEEKMNSGLGIFGLSTIVSMALGPTVGDFLVRSLGYEVMFYVAAATTLVAAVLMLGIRARKAERKEKKGIAFSDLFALEAMLPSLIILFDSVAMAVITNYLLLYGQEIGVANISLFFTIYSGALLVTRPFVNKISDTIDPKYLIYPCQFMITGCMVLLGLAQSLPMVVIASILFGIGYGAVSPLLQAMALKSVPENRRGAASGTYYFAMDIANILIPLCCAGLYQVFAGYASSYLIMAVAPLIGAAVLFLHNKKQKKYT